MMNFVLIDFMLLHLYFLAFSALRASIGASAIFMKRRPDFKPFMAGARFFRID